MAKLSRRHLAAYVANQLIAGASVASLVQQLAAYLIDTKRTKELHLIVRDVQYTLAQHGHVSGTITTASEMTAATRKALETYAKKATGAAHVQLDEMVDPTILGGVRLALPGLELDTTITRQLTALKTHYKKA